MAASAPQKFGFDTCFDEAGRVVSTAAPRPRRTYLAAEVEALQAQAFAEGQAAQRVSDEGRRAQALADIADACRQALPMPTSQANMPSLTGPRPPASRLRRERPWPPPRSTACRAPR